MIDDLMQQIDSLEREKLELVEQYEKYATLADDVVNYKNRLSEMSAIIEAKEIQLQKEIADKASIEHSQEELLRKMKELQKDNDELVVKLEGLKTENESLINKNKKLENRIKNLEDQNKQQLQQVNETLRLPVPIIKDHEITTASSEATTKKLNDLIQQQNSSETPSTENTNALYLSSSPPNLAIPTVNIVDEKRPASNEKELKVIPKIVEPSISDATRARDQYASTLNSQEASTPRESSGCSKNFGEDYQSGN